MSNPNQLFLLADHIKLSLLERQRAQSLNLGDQSGDSQDGHISRSLDQFRDGLAALSEEKARLEGQGDIRFVISTRFTFFPPVERLLGASAEDVPRLALVRGRLTLVD